MESLLGLNSAGWSELGSAVASPRYYNTMNADGSRRQQQQQQQQQQQLQRQQQPDNTISSSLIIHDHMKRLRLASVLPLRWPRAARRPPPTPPTAARRVRPLPPHDLADSHHCFTTLTPVPPSEEGAGHAPVSPRAARAQAACEREGKR